MSKHTPGPWVTHRDKWGELRIRSANPDDLAEAPIYYEIAERIGGHVRGDDFDDYSEVEANAQLIAAAPDLLAALWKVMADVPGDDLDDWYVMATAAITKATGGDL